MLCIYITLLDSFDSFRLKGKVLVSLNDNIFYYISCYNIDSLFLCNVQRLS